MPLIAAADRSHQARLGLGGTTRAQLRRAAASLGLACCGWMAVAAPAAHAQEASGGQIYIPGPGERGAAPSKAAAGAASEAANGMITIPGPGERSAAQASAAAREVMPVVVTAPSRTAKAAQPIALDRPAGASAGMAGAGAAAPARSLQSTKATLTTVSLRPATPAATVAGAPQPPAAAGTQDGESIHRVALAYLQQQAAGLPGTVTITVAPAFPRGLAACTTLVPFMPPGARMWGRTTVGVRCAGERPWTLYLQARVALQATYFLAAHPIEPGAVVTAADLTTREGDLANLPRTVVTDSSQAVGAVALARITAGVPLRQDMLRSASSVTIGQTVKVIAVGRGFTISSEGSVMNNASPGEQVRVKTAGGQIISGIVKDASTVEIPM